ncbi:MAG: NUDIX hydrolase [Patescibacteria group bacterium]
MIEQWITRIKEKVHDNGFFSVEKVTKTSDRGRESTFHLIGSPDWVVIIPLNQQEEVMVIQQFRHGSSSVSLEFPAGRVEMGEVPTEAAKRELAEETGLSTQNIVYLGAFNPNPAMFSNMCHVFTANQLVKTDKTDFDEFESVETLYLTVNQIQEKIQSGEIIHGLMVASFLYYLNKEQCER